MLTSTQWQAYRNVIDSAQDSFFQDDITWRRHTRGFQRYGEDNVVNENYIDIILKGLMAYNIFRVGPMTKSSEGGELDSQNILLVLNKTYLGNLGYLNSSSFFDMDPGKDIFIHRGIEYRSSGETEVGQAGDTALLFYIVLSREETPTGTHKY